MTDSLFVLVLAYPLDLLLGDPRFVPHPVKVIGAVTSRLENFIRRHVSGPRAEKCAGTFLVLLIVFLTWNLTELLVYVAGRDTGNPVFFLGSFLLIWFTSASLATRGLLDAACKVTTAIGRNDFEAARARLGEIVGRDTSSLDGNEMLTAVIETLAENASDGIIAPLFYYAVGGLPLALTYKAVNTLDSMLGYRDERYRHFGWAAARLDDLVNLIPARLTGILFSVAALALPQASGRSSLTTLIRDGRKHLSPNSGLPEAAMAGALGIRLGGPSTYRGVLVPKPYIGEPRGPVSLERADTALRLTFSVSLLGFLLASLYLLATRGPL